ncbi:aminotransferase class V-fold PLP-dependent enzyme, partial [Lactobacillus salivarius]|nr:aminotransferase class V-fold PLP-dependent enzyme [Ligilactobacillus salivarius]
MMKKTSDLRKDFPLLETKMNDQPLTYLDSAATSQKPKQVIDEIANYYNKYNSNIHRGVYNLAVETTDKYENVRHKVAKFINAYRDEEVLFTKGTTQSLNWIAQGYVRYNLHEGDEIVTTYMEHHSNIVPWQVIAQEKNLKVKYVTLTEEGKLDLDDLKQKITDKTKIVAVTHVSNVLGTINPIKEIAAIVHQSNAILVVDGAQSVPHLPVDIQDLEADFYVFSGHKMLGPTGIGVLW